MTYQRLIDFGTKCGFLWHANRARVDWAIAILARGETKDIEKSRELLEKALTEDRKMGVDGFVQIVADQLAALE
jgi:hypothetical protein